MQGRLSKLAQALLLGPLSSRLRLIRSALRAPARVRQLEQRLELVQHNFERLLLERHADQIPQPSQRDRLRAQEFSVHSQHGEDGLILFLLGRIGTPHRFFVEFGVQDGGECNTANLSFNFGWQGLLMEAERQDAVRARELYERRIYRDGQVVRVAREHVRPDNFNALLQQYGVPEEIDLLSIDIDGNDYWVWKALEVVSPRLVVIEYNASLGPERPLTIPYDPEFRYPDKYGSPLYHGASIAALAKLGQQKGYALVGCESWGVNAFFLRADLLTSELQPLAPEEAFYAHARRSRGQTLEEQWNRIRHLPHQEV